MCIRRFAKSFLSVPLPSTPPLCHVRPPPPQYPTPRHALCLLLGKSLPVFVGWPLLLQLEWLLLLLLPVPYSGMCSFGRSAVCYDYVHLQYTGSGAQCGVFAQQETGQLPAVCRNPFLKAIFENKVWCGLFSQKVQLSIYKHHTPTCHYSQHTSLLSALAEMDTDHYMSYGPRVQQRQSS